MTGSRKRADAPPEETPSTARQLQVSRAYFHAIVTRSADGVLVVDEEGVIQYANPAAQAILGRTLESLLGSVFGVPCVPGEPIEIDVLRDDGERRIAELRVSATNWDRRPAYLAAMRDVTERRAEEDRVRDEVRRRDAFLAMLSHELRNPLASINNAARVALRSLDDDPPGIAPALRVIDRQCGHVRRLLDDLLEVSRFTCGRIELRRERLVLQKVISDALDTGFTPEVERSDRLRVHLSPDPIHVDGDPARLVQVIVNLVGNAFKYTPDHGHVDVLAEADDDVATIHVRDEGCGIPPDECETIFDPFVQLETPQQGGDAGIGLGLALVRMIVERHDGTVTAHSEGVGRGTTFTVSLPVVNGAGTVAPVDRTGCRATRILLVEDDDDVREMMRTLLVLDGHDVEAVPGAAAALDIAIEKTFDVALVDIGMPGMDGYEVARRMRAIPELDALRLVALTGYGAPEDVRRALDAGFDHHLVKPVEMDALYAVIGCGARSTARR